MKHTIIGGGITGLTAALAFEKSGIDYKLYEAAPELNEVGAGIWMASNAMQVFGWLGVADRIQAQGMSLRHVELADDQFKTISSADQNVIASTLGYSIVSIHRARLQKVLFDAVPSQKIQLGKRLKSFHETNDEIRLEFEDGTASTTSALIAADGINSIVRKQLFPQATLRYSGQTCWRGVAKIDLDGHLSESCIEAWGNQIRFGISAISTSEVYWFAVATSPMGGKDDPGQTKQKLRLLFKDFAEPVDDILEATPEEKIIRSDISDLRPMPEWHKGKILLVGDAGHATTPNMGQGGAQGVEDAYYLAKVLSSEHSTEDAFKKFERFRRKKVNEIVSGSKNIGRLAHIRYGRSIRNILMRMVPDQLTTRQMMKLYTLRELR